MFSSAKNESPHVTIARHFHRSRKDCWWSDHSSVLPTSLLRSKPNMTMAAWDLQKDSAYQRASLALPRQVYSVPCMHRSLTLIGSPSPICGEAARSGRAVRTVHVDRKNRWVSGWGRIKRTISWRSRSIVEVGRCKRRLRMILSRGSIVEKYTGARVLIQSLQNTRPLTKLIFSNPKLAAFNNFLNREGAVL